jgi:hypothetical protein
LGTKNDHAYLTGSSPADLTYWLKILKKFNFFRESSWTVLYLAVLLRWLLSGVGA